MRWFLLSAVLVLSNTVHARESRFSLLTCSPGSELYSVFGHSAIRFRDTLEGRPVDWVYNYGTFIFDDDFYFKFAKGRLRYMLSKESMDEFMYEYQYFGRGVQEQALNLDEAQEWRLLQLLEENYMPENRFYDYDFFYDNCATRIRDMVRTALNDSLDFTYVPAHRYTFRQAIQHYLDYLPWADFGIDLALGLPCDAVMKHGDDMFLPDSLMMEFQFATIPGKALTKAPVQLLPQQLVLKKGGWFTPLNVCVVFLLFQLSAHWWLRRKTLWLADRLLMAVAGLIGVVIVFLWFFTDHKATVYNFNLLWASPLYLVLTFTGFQRNWQRLLHRMALFMTLVPLAGYFFIPQQLHLATIPLMTGLMWVGIKVWRAGMVNK